jgi:uncharacterized protein YceK
MTVQRRIARIALLAAGFLMVTSGCATLEVRQSSYPPIQSTAYYPATTADIRVMGWALTGAEVSLHTLLGPPETCWPLTPLFLAGALLDLPFSLVFDTLLLPADLAHARNRRMTEATRAAPISGTFVVATNTIGESSTLDLTKQTLTYLDQQYGKSPHWRLSINQCVQTSKTPISGYYIVQYRYGWKTGVLNATYNDYEHNKTFSFEQDGEK